MNQEQPLRPANIANIVGINQGKRPLTMEDPVAEALSPEAANDLIQDGCLVIDCRSSATFGAGHIPGAYNMQLSSSEFEQRVGWVTPLDVPMILVANTSEEAQRAIHLLAFLGLDQRVKGFVEGGIPAWANAGLPVSKLEQMSAQTLYQKLQSNGHQVLDVRETSEWDEGHVENAHYMNFKVIRNQISELTVTPDDHIAIVCATGKRSSTAGSILLMNGYEHVHNIIGGMTAWRDAGLPMINAEGVVCNV
ncbi:MAG: rhodanese-like domain-containing protein [Ardenticatenaceae bacterium]